MQCSKGVCNGLPYSKAFDTVKQDLLFYKLKLPPLYVYQVLNWFLSFLTNSGVKAPRKEALRSLFI